MLVNVASTMLQLVVDDNKDSAEDVAWTVVRNFDKLPKDVQNYYSS
jgi:hypothetical protein